jgi:hypothetical protein
VLKLRDRLATLPPPGSPFVLLVTGSSDPEFDIWVDVMADCFMELERWLRRHPMDGRVKILRHGRAPGIDTIAHIRAGAMGWHRDPMPAEWRHWGRRSGIIRNHAMVIKDPKPNLCLAFFASMRTRGTADCAGQARNAGIPTVPITVEDLYLAHKPA